MDHKIVRWASALAALALTLTACGGSDSDSPSASATGSAECLDSVSTFLQDYQELPTKLAPDLKPLAEKPEPGGKVIQIVNGSITNDVRTNNALKRAAASVGWTAEGISYDGSPEDLAAKYDRAIAENPDAILTAGPPAAVYAKQLAAAQEAGIISIMNSGQEPVDMTTGPQATLNGADAYDLQGQANAYKFLDAVKCAPTKVIVATLDFPALNTMVKGFTTVVEEQCPDCTIKTTKLDAAALGTPAATNSVLASLQSDPSVKYVFASLANAVDGLPVALASANLTDIHIFGSIPSEQSVTALQEGKNDWWVTQSPEIDGWSMLHEALLAKADDTTVSLTGTAIGFLTPDNIPSDATAPPSYPTDYEEQFKELWHVG